LTMYSDLPHAPTVQLVPWLHAGPEVLIMLMICSRAYWFRVLGLGLGVRVALNPKPYTLNPKP